MTPVWLVGRRIVSAVAAVFLLVIVARVPATGQTPDTESVTFTKHIAPILQRNCQSCHRPNSLAPMSLITYEEVRPWARSIKHRTALRNRMGAMPPWFLEKDIGIQQIQSDMSLSESEIATFARWADNGAPRGNPSDLPPPRVFAGPGQWEIGTPDLVVKVPSKAVKADSPDWWGAVSPVRTGLSEDRYVETMQIKEINDVPTTVDRRYIFHHAFFSMVDESGNRLNSGPWPTIHDLRNSGEGYAFESDAGRFLPAHSLLHYDQMHVHSNGEDTAAHLEVAFKFHPKDYKPARKIGRLGIGTGEIDVLPMEANQELHFYQTLDNNVRFIQFGPHMHAAGVRMCLEVIWAGRSETLNCAGYDHNWLRYYRYEDDAAPLLPKGAILHGIAYFDSTAANPNIIDPRNWSGMGHRAIDNMALLLAPAFILTDEEFQEEMSVRRARLDLAEGETVLGCPLCGFNKLPASRLASDQQ